MRVCAAGSTGKHLALYRPAPCPSAQCSEEKAYDFSPRRGRGGFVCSWRSEAKPQVETVSP